MQSLRLREWHSSARVRFAVALAVLLGLTALLAGGAVADLRTEWRLVAADPDALPQDSPLMRFAVPRGARVFAARCSSCHGVGGTGDRVGGVPDLTGLSWLYGGGQPSDIERIVAYGIRAQNPKGWDLAIMPAFGTATPSSDPNVKPLPPGEIDDLVEYLVELGGKPADSAAAARGRKLFGGRGGCFDCHTVNAKGDSAIGAPDLTGARWIYGDGARQALFDSIARGRKGVCPAWIDRLSAAQIREVALYVRSLTESR